jgi:hypothetical protein
MGGMPSPSNYEAIPSLPLIPENLTCDIHGVLVATNFNFQQIPIPKIQNGSLVTSPGILP